MAKSRTKIGEERWIEETVSILKRMSLEDWKKEDLKEFRSLSELICFQRAFLTRNGMISHEQAKNEQARKISELELLIEKYKIESEEMADLIKKVIAIDQEENQKKCNEYKEALDGLIRIERKAEKKLFHEEKQLQKLEEQLSSVQNYSLAPKVAEQQELIALIKGKLNEISAKKEELLKKLKDSKDLLQENLEQQREFAAKEKALKERIDIDVSTMSIIKDDLGSMNNIILFHRSSKLFSICSHPYEEIWVTERDYKDLFRELAERTGDVFSPARIISENEKGEIRVPFSLRNKMMSDKWASVIDYCKMAMFAIENIKENRKIILSFEDDKIDSILSSNGVKTSDRIIVI